MEIAKPIIESIAERKIWFRRLGLWVTGIGSYYIFTWIYDYLIISALLVYFGVLKGGIIAMVVSMLIDFFTLKFYDWLKKDWLALETIKELNDKKGFIGKKAKIITPFGLRIVGAIVGSIGFFLIAYRIPILGTALIGIGSVLIAAGES